jgi:ATP/maltotriose-dependent transcriptional regulator MalT
VIIIEGIPGMGKSSLAKEFGRDPLVKDLPKVWIKCEEGMPVESFINRIAEALDPKIAHEIRAIASMSAPLWQKASSIGAILDAHRCVLFLDAYERAISTSVHDFVAELCEVLQEAKVIITSRIVPPSDLRSGVTRLLDQLPEARSEVQKYLMTEALQDLPTSAQSLLRVICTFRRSVPVLKEAIEALYKEADLSDMLQLLVRRSLVEGIEGKYSAHDLVREFCVSELGISPQLHSSAVGYYLARSGGISQASLDDLGEAYYHSLQAHPHDLAYEVFLVLAKQLDMKGYYDWLIKACKKNARIERSISRSARCGPHQFGPGLSAQKRV